METQFIRLNMIPSGVIPIFNISQYDVGRMLGVYVYAGIRNVNLDNYTVTVEATRSDGTAIIVGVTTNNNVGTFEVTPVMSNLANSYKAQLVITDRNSRRIASLPFIINVIRAAMNENSEAIEEDATLYQQYTDAMQSIIAETKADIVDEAIERQANIDAEATARANAIAQVNTSLANETNARKQADTTINARINNIIAPSGSAPNAAEIIDARVGANGTTYSNLGTAIRTQIGDLTQEINANWATAGKMGAKNLLPPNYEEIDLSRNGIMWQGNEDGSITINGQINTSSYSFIKLFYPFDIGVGKYTLNVKAPSFLETLNAHIIIRLTNETNNTSSVLAKAYANGDEKTFEVTQTMYDAIQNGTAFIYVIAQVDDVNEVFDNVTIYPMLRYAADTDDTWQPYAMTNKELTESIKQVADKSLENTDNIWKAQGELGAKNLLVYPYYETTITMDGVTWVSNDDGSVAINGQIESGKSYSFFYLHQKLKTLDAGTYKASIDFELSAQTHVNMLVRLSNWDGNDYINLANVNYSNKEVEFTITAEMKVAIDAETSDLYIILQANDTSEVYNTTAYPMLRYAVDTDNTWQPYVLTNRELVNVIKTTESHINDLNNAMAAKTDWSTAGKLGAKNLIPTYNLPMSNNGIIYSLNNDGSINIDGTATDHSSYAVNLPKLEVGTYILSTKEILPTDIYIQLLDYTSGVSIITIGNNSDLISQSGAITPNIKDHLFQIRYIVGNDNIGIAIENLTIYPMLRYAADTDDTWQPYAMTNKELTDNINRLKNEKISAYDLPYISNQKLCCNRVNDIATAYYAGVNLGEKVNKIYANFIYEDKREATGGVGTVALILNKNGVTKIRNITDLSIHCTISELKVRVDVFGDNFGTRYYQNLIDENVSLAADGTTEHTVILTVSPSTNTVRVEIDGTLYSGTFTPTEDIATLNDVIGNYATIEHYCQGNRNNIAMPMFTYFAVANLSSVILLKDYFDRQDGQLSTAPNGIPYSLMNNGKYQA